MTRNELDIVEHFKQFNCHGNGLVIKGRIRVGKTYLLGIIAKLLLGNGFAIITNVRFDDSEFEKYKSRLFYISSDLEYFEHYLQIPETIPIVLMWDDIQAQSGFKSTDYDQFTKLSQFLIFMGKFETNYVYVAHQKYIPDCILDGFEPLFIYKKAKEWFYACKELHTSMNDICSNCVYVPQPTSKQLEPLKILSKAISRFEWTLDLSNLYNYLSRKEIKENLRKGVKAYLEHSDTIGEYEHLKNLSLQEILLAIYFKRGIISGGTKLNKVFNSNTLDTVKKLIKDKNLKLKS